MLRRLIARHRSWPLATPFRISRGVKHSAEVVVVEIRHGGIAGRGEAVPYARYGETVDSVLGQIGLAKGAIASGINRAQLDELLSPGAARNAIDCALWDLEANRTGSSVAALLGRTPPPALASAQTIGIDTPERMARAAAQVATLELIKLKVDACDPGTRIRAVRQAAPDARLIVDANESWTLDLLRELQPVLAEARVDLIEQPLPAAQDEALSGFVSATPICADESCHVAADLPRLRDRYQAVNIKLDKTGGLSEALRLLKAAREGGFRVMVGCMVCSSLGIAPAFHVARDAEFVDLDGPLWLRRDRDDGVRMRDGRLHPPAPGFWGGAGVAPSQPPDRRVHPGASA
ncbi:N-acetyl-D-Glu racemase DgcA [Luteimonas sp. R10]|uniref:N-acetyl-D-Glu racemase DgcA n=1 Tax=Luteimonas sp. R10 TaxID=3108176 RepID=UPI003086FB15|nr:N-acetyl-D-Glu racemase DgcA [Luteimonas sp. R10]